MATDNPNGFGSFLGLPSGVETRDDLLRHKRKQGLEKFRERMAETAKGMATPADQTLFNVFAQIGAGLESKISGSPAFGGELTEAEERQITAFEKFQEREREMRKTEEWKNADENQRGYMRGRALSDAQWDAGDHVGSLNTLEAIAKRKLARREAQARTRGLEAEADVAEAKAPLEIDAAAAAREALAEGKPQVFIPVTEGEVDLYSPTTLRQMPNGKLVDGAGNEVDRNQYMLLDEATRWADMASDINADTTSVTDFAVDFFGKSELAKYREGVGRVRQIAQVTEKVADAMTEAREAGDAVGVPGTLYRVADNARSILKAGKDAMRVFGAVDEEGKGVGEGRSLASAAQDLIPDDAVPADILEQGAAAASKYKSAVMEILYIDAKMYEEGARQLSDADIHNAAERLGINSSNPAVILSTFGTKMQEHLAQSKAKYEGYANILREKGYDPSTGMTRTLGHDALGIIDNASKRVDKALGRGEERTGVPPTRTQEVPPMLARPGMESAPQAGTTGESGVVDDILSM